MVRSTFKGFVGFQGCLDLGDGVSEFSWLFGTTSIVKHGHQVRAISGSFVTINEWPNLSAQWRFGFAVIFAAGRRVKEQIKENTDLCLVCT